VLYVSYTYDVKKTSLLYYYIDVFVETTVGILPASVKCVYGLDQMNQSATFLYIW